MRILGVIVLLALLSGCSSGLNRPVHEVTATMGSDNVQHVQVVAHSFWFEPNRVVVKRGTPVELKVKNGALFVPHNLTCTAPETDVLVSADLGGLFHRGHTLRFTPTQAGEYRFYCHVDGHAKKGMTGSLVVVP
jgi:plastocyanin